MDNEMKGNINQKLQIILSSAQNCRKEVKAGAITGKAVVRDMERIAKNVEDIVAIMNGVPEMLVILVEKPKENGDGVYYKLSRYKEIICKLEYFLDDCEAGDSVGFSVVEMSEEELESLPDIDDL